MATKHFYSAAEARKLLSEDSSKSDDENDVESESDSSSGQYVPSSDDRSDSSFDKCDDTDTTTVDQQR